MKKHAPATLRNREVILEVLREELPATGTVLEVAAGSGEHALFFAERLSSLDWLPTDRDPDALVSIASYREDYDGDNLLEPIGLDAAMANWRVPDLDAIVCINMVHISPWAATRGVFKEAEGRLREGAPIIFYGPYFEDGLETAPSNADFDLSLRARNPAWGIRNLKDMDALAQRHGFIRSARREMPANNLTLVYRQR